MQYPNATKKCINYQNLRSKSVQCAFLTNFLLFINYLLKSIEKDTQTIITSVDTILFEDEFLKDVIIYKVDGGKIV